jgi:hypothetical protein
MDSNMVKETKLLIPGRSPALISKGKDSLEHVSDAAGTSTYIEDIHHRAETVTTLLKKFLDYRPPPHWGINE